MNPLVSVNLVFHKEKNFFKPQLDSLAAQTYTNIEINTWDNTKNNIGFWAGQEQLLKKSNGKYIICMTDVVLDRNFVTHAVEIMERDSNIGALQAKILQHATWNMEHKKIIDTTGFQIFKTRRIINRGKGKEDRGQYKEGEIFAVEGAVPVFRKEALEDCVVDGHLIDPDFRIGPLGYGDDLDLAWRMRNFGWKQWYAPSVITYHDRSTAGPRSSIPLMKRQLDWCNVRFAIIKNDAILHLILDAPFWIFREIAVLGYMLIFEPRVLGIVPRFIKLLPCMLSRRKLVMSRKKSTNRVLRSLFS